MNRFLFIVGVALLVLLTSNLVLGQDADDKKAWLGLMAKQAERYEFVSSSGNVEFRMTQKPVFRHDAPSRRSDDIGGVWVWKDQHNRPVAAGTVFGWTSSPGTRTVMHEFCSLSRTPFNAMWKQPGRFEKWNPKETSQWKPLPKSLVPSQNKVVLRSQISQQARRFAAHAFRGNTRWQLRLIPSPIYRYESPELENTLGGAVFVICQDTNTDVVIGIEAVRRKQGEPYRFEYTLGSFTDMDLHVELDRKEIWRERPSDPRGWRDLHWVRRTGPIQLATSD